MEKTFLIGNGINNIHEKDKHSWEKILEQLEDFSRSKFEKVYDGILDKFAYYFTRLEIQGIDNCLSDYNNFDGVSKDYYLKLIEKSFNDLKAKGITSLKAVSGTCNGCIKGCKGFSFVDNETGIYVDIIVEVEHKEITNFMECYDLINDCHKLNKKERIVIKHYKVNS